MVTCNGNLSHLLSLCCRLSRHHTGLHYLCVPPKITLCQNNKITLCQNNKWLLTGHLYVHCGISSEGTLAYLFFGTEIYSPMCVDFDKTHILEVALISRVAVEKIH